MAERPSRQGWIPDVPDAGALADALDEAFDYRGDVTIETRDGRHRIGYVYNRSRHGPAPFIQLMPAGGGESETIAYAEIRGIAFTGRDTAAGNSYAAWLKRKQAGQAAAPEPPDDDAAPDA